MTDINEVNNQIDLGFKEPDVAKPALAKLLLQSRIPVGAVRSLSWTEAPVTQTLDDFFPSIPGGVNAYAFGRGWCTAGINVLYNGVPALLTASHCGPMMGGMDGAAWGHGNSTTTLGWEIADPGSGCPFFQCRRSDVAVIQSSGGIPGELGMIARTTFVGAYPPVSNGSTTIDPNQPRFPLFWPGYPTSSPLMGEIMNKVGRATGWTSGPINKTCFTQQQTQTGWYMLCTYRFNGATTTGDSGAPVFHRLTCPGETWPAINCASFAGILWGGGDGHSYFSTTSNIRADFPNSSFVFVQ